MENNQEGAVAAEMSKVSSSEKLITEPEMKNMLEGIKQDVGVNDDQVDGAVESPPVAKVEDEPKEVAASQELDTKDVDIIVTDDASATITVYEDKIDDGASVPAYEFQTVEETTTTSASEEVVSSAVETESPAQEEKEEEKEEDTSIVAAAALGAAAATTAVVSTNDDATPKDVEEGGEATNSNAANEEDPNEEVASPPQDEEEGLQTNPEDSAAVGAALSPVAEMSVQSEDQSASAASEGDEASEERQTRDSCWKRNKCLTAFIILMILFVIAAAVLIVLFLIGPLRHDAAQKSLDGAGDGNEVANRCNVLDLGPFYQEDCETCVHSVALDSETGFIGRNDFTVDSSMQFLPKDRTFIPGQTFPYLSHKVVALMGNYAALGDPSAGDGVVYIYEKDPAGVWNDVKAITSANLNGGEAGARFGRAVAIYGDKMVVGAPGDVNESGVSTGSVYVYSRQEGGDWLEETKLYSTTSEVEGFGTGVSLEGGTLAITGMDTIMSREGMVFVYRHDDIANSWELSSDGTLMIDNGCQTWRGNSAEVTDTGGILVLRVFDSCSESLGFKRAVYYYTPSSDGGYDLKQEISIRDDNYSWTADEMKIFVDKDRMLVFDVDSALIFELDDGIWKKVALIESPFSSLMAYGTDAALAGDDIFISWVENTHSYIVEC